METKASDEVHDTFVACMNASRSDFVLYRIMLCHNTSSHSRVAFQQDDTVSFLEETFGYCKTGDPSPNNDNLLWHSY